MTGLAQWSVLLPARLRSRVRILASAVTFFLEIENNRELTVLLMYACINFTTSGEIYADINYDVTAQ